MEKCIFLDKDGTLIYDEPYNVSLDKIRCYEDIYAPLRNLTEVGYKLIIVSNQSGIAKRYFTEKQLHEAFKHLVSILRKEGVYITDYYFCPHASPERKQEHVKACSCRKPLPGLLTQAAEDYNIDLTQSWMIGDIIADTGAGRAAGCNTILIDRNGQERTRALISHPSYRPDIIVDHFFSIDAIILKTKIKNYESADEQYPSRI